VILMAARKYFIVPDTQKDGETEPEES